MVEREIGENKEEGRTKGELIGKLMGLPSVRHQLQSRGVQWVSRPGMAPSADILFVGTKKGESKGYDAAGRVRSITLMLAGVEVYVAAIVVIDEDDNVQERYLQVEKELNAEGQLNEGVVIGHLYKRQIEYWLNNQKMVQPAETNSQLMTDESAEVISEEKLAFMEEVIPALFGEGGWLEKECSFVDGRSVTAGLDILFVPKEGGGEGRPMTLTMYGGGHGEVGMGEEAPIANVAGMIFFEDGISVRARKEKLRGVQTWVRTWFSNRELQILAVTKQTLQMWREKGRVVALEKDVVAFLEDSDEVTQVRHGFYIPSRTGGEVSLRMFEPDHSDIGGTQMFFTNKRGGLRQTVLLDFGWPFGRDENIDSVLGRPGYPAGLLPYLRAGIIPDVPRLLRHDLLDVSMSAQLFNTEDRYGMFVLKELYHRHGLPDLKEMTRKTIPVYEANAINWRRWEQILPRWREKEYLDKEQFLAMLFTHGHQDHAAGGSFVRFEIPAGMSKKTHLVCEVDYISGWHWTVQEMIKRKMRETGKKNAYPVEDRSVIVFEEGETIDLGGGIRATGWPIYHSMDAMGYHLESVDAFSNVIASLAYPGDYRFDTRFFAEVGKRGVHTLFVEGTNPPGVKKSSAAVTEAMVKDNIHKELKESNVDNELLVIRVVKGNEERLQNLVEIAGDRIVLVSRRVAQFLHMDNIWQQLNKDEEEALDEEEWLRLLEEGKMSLGAPLLRSDRVFVYKGNKQSYHKWEKELMEMYGNVSDDEMSAFPRKFMLILDHRDRISNLGIGGQGTKVKFIDSIYWAYDDSAKKEVRHVMNECERRGWKYLSDFRAGSGGLIAAAQGRFHASGHTDFEHQVEMIKLAHPERIIIGHTQKRGVMADALERALRDALPGLEIVGSMTHPWGIVEF